MILAQTPQITKTCGIRFSRKTRQWHLLTAHNGKITSHTKCGNGPDGKRVALLKALAISQPEIFQSVNAIIAQENSNPGTVDRLIKAAKLVVDNRVFDGLVQSGSDDKTFYKVDFSGSPKKYNCNCPDAATAVYSFGHGRPMCKHLWATHIAWRLGRTLTAAPIPFKGETIVTHAALIDDSGLPF